MARKPLTGTVAENVLAHGTGALNIDGCRVEGWKPQVTQGINSNASSFNVAKERRISGDSNEGRWPANLIHDGSDEVLAAFPQAQGQQGKTGKRTQGAVYGVVTQDGEGVEPRGDTGSAARFFYCAKASRADRNDGLPSGADPAVRTNATMRERENASWQDRNGNHHPTVKPTDLMRYLVRLVTPPGGLVLDPFMGSGSTGKAALIEGFAFIGIEREASFVEIARARIKAAGMPLFAEAAE